jgi:GNAT superfamily N-acetyltransferase
VQRCGIEFQATCGEKRVGSDLTPELRLANSEDLPAIANFLPELGGPHFAERFPHKTVEDFYRWKYFTNPAGQAIVAAATVGSRVVSVVAAIPKRVSYQGQTKIVYELGDFLTALDFRGKGLFTRLIEMVCQEVSNRGGAFVYVRPNENSFPILAAKSAFQEVRHIDARRFVLPSGVISRKTKLPAGLLRLSGMDFFTRAACVPKSRGTSVTVERVERFGPEINNLWERAARDHEFALVRDVDYLNWRFSDCPTRYQIWIARRHDIAGYLVAFTHETGNMASLVDVFSESRDEEAAEALLGNCFRSFLANGVDSLHTWVLQGSSGSTEASLRRAFPFRGKQHLHLAMKPLREGLPAHPENWLITMGDFDGI